ncbi:DsbA family protein [Salinicoccus hispanicus]|uniref:Thioredoxin domain-containing protein n=1 Tax=Salinicoccus hispanicus TaxID=157225 RepID=A0A6N8TYT1_9STAP|nr:DsbA family oxidoreductase [Salinicoccus hispanicus]MXQ50642.1 thioredoxin domain-containing protein [Salinicoccus hispanicus]
MEIEIWSDIGCPFCYIGKRNFEMGLDQFDAKDQVNVIYRSFRLDPTAPVQPEETMVELLAKKYGRSLEEAKQMNAQISDSARAAGLEFNLDTVVPSNTMDAHRLVKQAETAGKDDMAMEYLYKAYFTDNRNVADRETLLEIAGDIGLDISAVDNMFSADDYKEAVISDQNEATQHGAQGVPYFVINRKYSVSGAQPPEKFLEAMKKVQQEEESLVDLGDNQGSTCTDEYCE